MKRTCVVLLVWLQGCSLAWLDTQRKSPPLVRDDCPSRVRGVVDGVAAGSFGLVTGDAYVHRNDADSAANLFVVPLAAAALLFVGSAIYGFVEPGRCERIFSDSRDE